MVIQRQFWNIPTCFYTCHHNTYHQSKSSKEAINIIFTITLFLLTLMIATSISQGTLVLYLTKTILWGSTCVWVTTTYFRSPFYLSRIIMISSTFFCLALSLAAIRSISTTIWTWFTNKPTLFFEFAGLSLQHTSI